MKRLTVIIVGFILAFGAVASRGSNVDRISAATGVPVATLQAERASTGLGWGSLENAHLLANASGQSFDSIVAQHQAGQGWGKIAHDNGFYPGRLVSTLTGPARRRRMRRIPARCMATVRPLTRKARQSMARAPRTLAEATLPR